MTTRDELEPQCPWTALPQAACGCRRPGCDPKAPMLAPTPTAPVVGHLYAYAGRQVIPAPSTPPDPGKPLTLSTRPAAGYCACGTPTRDNAYGCDACAGEIQRYLTDVPWLINELDTSMARIRAKSLGGGHGGGRGTALPWLDKAAIAQRRVTGLLEHTVRLCERVNVPHQSPHPGPPDDNPRAIARWLLWRVDGLPHVPLFPDVLRATMQTERHVLGVINCAPDLIFLGTCTVERDDSICGGGVYAVKGNATGKCRVCRAAVLTEPARARLFTNLDDRLCTAAEIAELSTYLGLPSTVTRDRVRKQVNLWHHRGRLAGTGPEKAPRFRYGDVRTLLAQTYDTKE